MKIFYLIAICFFIQFGKSLAQVPTLDWAVICYNVELVPPYNHQQYAQNTFNLGAPVFSGIKLNNLQESIYIRHQWFSVSDPGTPVFDTETDPNYFYISNAGGSIISHSPPGSSGNSNLAAGDYYCIFSYKYQSEGSYTYLATQNFTVLSQILSVDWAVVCYNVELVFPYNHQQYEQYSFNTGEPIFSGISLTNVQESLNIRHQWFNANDPSTPVFDTGPLYHYNANAGDHIISHAPFGSTGITSLPPGNYYSEISYKYDSDISFTLLETKNFTINSNCLPPTNLVFNSVENSLNWTAPTQITCNNSYAIFYRAQGATTWNDSQFSNVGNCLDGLLPSTDSYFNLPPCQSYEFAVQMVCNNGGNISSSDLSEIVAGYTSGCNLSCPSTIDSILCLPWLRDSIIQINDYSCGGFFDYTIDLVEYQGNKLISIGASGGTDCCSRKYYTCDGAYYGNSTSTIAGTFYMPSEIANYQFQQTLWECADPVPLCLHDVSCPAAPDSLLCLNWVSNLLSGIPSTNCSSYLSTGNFQGNTVIVFQNVCGEAGLTTGCQTIYQCDGTEIVQSCGWPGPIISAYHQEILNGITGLTEIWNSGDPLPDCNCLNFEANITGITSICMGQSTILTAGGGSSGSQYQWSGALGTQSTATVTMPGTYTVTITRPDGCSSTATATISILPSFSVNLSGENTFCTGDPGGVLLSVQPITSASYHWFPVGGDTSAIVVYPENGSNTFSVTVTIPGGCSASATKSITIIQQPDIDISTDDSDLLICAGSAITLTASDGALNYVWNTSANTKNITVYPESTTEYRVIGSVNQFCPDTNFITIMVQSPPQAQITAPAVACIPELILIGNTPVGATGQWAALQGGVVISPNEAETQAELTSGINRFSWILNAPPCPADTAVISVLFADNIPECNMDKQLILVNTTAELNVLENDSNAPVDSIQINLTSDTTGVWSVSPTGELTYTPHPGFKGVAQAIYIVCNTFCPEFCDSAKVEIKVSDPNSEIGQTQAITPDGDGNNDNLVFDYLEQYPANSIVIFNRWGQKVFEAHPYHNDWAGQYQGNPLPAGTYYYILNLEGEDESVWGNILIVR